jgi:hypothetical protein
VHHGGIVGPHSKGGPVFDYRLFPVTPFLCNSAPQQARLQLELRYLPEAVQQISTAIQLAGGMTLECALPQFRSSFHCVPFAKNLNDGTEDF